MDYYEDERQRTRPQRERQRRRDSYDDDDVYSSRGNNNRTTTLVKRRDSYDDVDEEITREFSPPGGGRGYVRETTIRKSGVRPSRARSYDDDRHYDDRYDDGPYGGGRRYDRYRDDDRDGRDRRRRYSSGSSRSRSRTPPRKENRKSKLEETLEALGLGALVGGVAGKEAKDRSSSRDRARSKSRSGRDRASSVTTSDRRRSRSRGGVTRDQLIQAAKAAVLAGAGEAFRARKEPGGMSGEKGKRILTAAFSAAGVDGLINAGKDPEHHKIRDTVGSAVAGMATSRIVNGSRSKSRGRRGSRSPDSRRGRSSSRGGVGDLLAAGAVTAAAKKVYDNVRSRSRGRSESPSRYSDVSRSRSPSRSKSRRRSVSRTAARGLAAVGLNKAADKVDPERRSVGRRNSDDYDDRGSYYESREVGHSQPGDVNGHARDLNQSHPDAQAIQQRAAPTNYSLDFGPHHYGDPDTDSDSDLGSSSGEERERKKSKRKLLLTSGLASIATIHAGHSVYQSYEKRHARKLAVKEGKISPEQARKSQNKERLTEAASLGIAAIGLKGAYSEWKEMHEFRKEHLEELDKMKRHQAKREARREKAERLKREGYLDSGYASSMPNLHSPPPMNAPPGGWHQPFEEPIHYAGQGPYSAGGQQPNGPHYYDGNPYYAGSYAYSAEQVNGSPLPPPPVGADHYGSRAPRQRSPSRGRSADRL